MKKPIVHALWASSLDLDCDGVLEVDIVDGGSSNSCGIDNTGSIQCWGNNYYGQSNPPTGTFTTLSLGEDHGPLRVIGL